MDGASGQQTTRQKWSSNETEVLVVDQSENNIEESAIFDEEPEGVSSNQLPIKNMSDKSVFGICFVPLQLKSDRNIIWVNNKPSSIFYCRPIKFQFTKEEKNFVKEQYKYYTDLLEQVESWNFYIGEIQFTVSFDLKCTMIDGKICNWLTDQDSTQSCNICRVTPSKINDLKFIQTLNIQENYYKFGLSTLHAWIKSLEYILHISYKLDIRENDSRAVKKQKIVERKAIVQKVLKEKLQLSVDVVKQGFGTTNTGKIFYKLIFFTYTEKFYYYLGNVSREFFSHAQVAAECTGVSHELIKRLYTILQVFTCGRKPRDVSKFENYALKTAQLFIEKYNWYKKPPSVHKMLIHGGKIIRSFELPIGWYSEEAQEANNKIFRKARANFSRMTDRLHTNQDTFKYLLVNSDPFLASLRKTAEKRHKPLTAEAENLLK